MKKILAVLTVILTLTFYTAHSFGEGWLTDWMDSSPEALITTVDHDFEGNVIIIGAGAAGMAAATLLEQNGIDYSILEATSRYGGRLEQNTRFADFPLDLGAEWIHQDKSILNRLTGKPETSPASRELIRYSPSDVYSLDDGVYEKVPSYLLKLIQWSYPEYKFKNSTWFSFVQEHFASHVESKIIYNSPVTAIDYSGNKVIVTTLNGQQYLADKVISTVSIGVLKANYIRFIPELTQQKQAAIQSVAFLPGFKLFLKFSNKFYPDAIEVETNSGEKTYYDVAYQKEAEDKVFGLLSTGESAEYYYSLGSEQAIVNAVLTELDQLFDGKASASYSDEYLMKDWGKAQFTLGTWTDQYKDESLIEALQAPLSNKVYFAGETFDRYGQNSTVQGAVISGYSAAYQILE